MEGERGDVGSGSSLSVSESSLSGKLPGEPPVEETGGESHVEESNEEGNRGEIMVEVVGSDVFVDGVSGQKEGYVGSGEVRDLEGNAGQNREETGVKDVDVLNGREGNKMGTSDVGFLESKGECDNVVAEEVAVGINGSVNVGDGAVSELQSGGVSVVEDEIWNPGAEAMVVSSSAVKENVSGQTEEIVERNAVVIHEEKVLKGEAVDGSSVNLVTSEHLNHPAKAVGEEKIVTAVKEELLSTNDGAAGHDRLGQDSVTTREATDAADGTPTVPSDVSVDPNHEGLDNAQFGGVDSVVEEAGLVDATKGGEALAAGSPKDEVFKANSKSASTRSYCAAEAEVSDEKVVSVESKDSIQKTYAIVSDVQVRDQGCFKELDGMKSEPEQGIDDTNEKTLVCERGETDIVHQNNEPAQLADEGGMAEVGVDKVLNFGIQADKKEDQPNITSSSCSGDGEIVASQVKVEDEDGSSEKGEKADPETTMRPITRTGCTEIPAVGTATENIQLSPKASDINVETSDAMVIEDHVECNDPVDNTEVGLDSAVEMCGSHQGKEQEVAALTTEASNVSVQITETSNDGADGLEGIDLKPSVVTSTVAVSIIDQADILPETTETKLMNMEEAKESDRNYEGMEVDCMEPQLGTEELASETNQLKLSNEEMLKSTSSSGMNQSRYLLPQDNEGHFAQSDLVWGKVRSHPWWPGQIFDPADASENAAKYYKKDAYLVAYFGDRTFAWNDASVLKPFMSHFSQIEKLSNSEAFQSAVNCALAEVSRRVELGLACSCISEDAYRKIECQVIENTGICEESSHRYGVDQCTSAASFEPDKLLEYVRGLAASTSSYAADRLDLVIAQAQLSSFCHYKGYRSPTEFPLSGKLLENEADAEQVGGEMAAPQKCKQTTEDGPQSRKERSLTELMRDQEYSPDVKNESASEGLDKSFSVPSGRKRKALDPLDDGSEDTISNTAAKLSTSMSQSPKPSFKIGECIRRVASQLTGSTSLLKGNNDEMVTEGSPKIYEQSVRRSVVISAESYTANEMLSHLELLAQNPKKGHNLQYNVHSFFLGFRSSVALNRRGRKRKAERTSGGSGEEFEFDDVNDSYWMDRIVQNYSGEQLLHDQENGAGNLQLVSFGTDKSVKSGRRSHSRKRFSSGNYPMQTTELDKSVERRKQESSPAELVLNFAEKGCVPSEINLNKMFRRFGSLMESETEVDHESGRAKVIFKRGSDAEVALSSAEKFNIFGAVLVNYQIGYSPVISVKILPVTIPQFQEDETLML